MTQHARIDPTPIQFIDIAAQRQRLQPALDEAIAIYGKDDLERENGQALGEPVASRD